MWRRLTPLVGIVPFGLSVWVLAREVERVGPARLAHALASVPHPAILAAVLLTAFNYFVMTLHDQLAFRYAGVRLPSRQIAIASFVGYAVSNNVGFALLSGTTTRFRFYARAGVSAADLSRIVLFYTATFWIGLCLVGGLALLAAPPSGLTHIVPAQLSGALGLLGIVLVGAYVAACLLGRGPVQIGRFSVRLPGTALLGAQILVSTADWLLAAAVLFALLPDSRTSFLMFAGAFVVAQLLGIASHVPGGLGVFEGLMVLLLPGVPTGGLLTALLAFRVVYYLLPLAAAVVILSADEAVHRAESLTAWSRTCRRLAAAVMPSALAVFTFVGGLVLLLSGAVPAVPARMAWLARVVPLPLVEASHFTASLIGLTLLLLAQGVARRVDAAFYVTAVTLAVGSAASLLKGADYEEASLLALVLVGLIAARRHFTRRARVFEDPLSAGWLAAMAVAIAASVWLGTFAYKHVAYSNDLWWRFEFQADAPRFLRASVGVILTALVISVRQLLRPVFQHRSGADDRGADLERVIEHQPRASANLVYLGDKSVLWDSRHQAFLMYAVRGGFAVALGDPVGDPRAGNTVIREFLAMCERAGFQPLFYETSRDYLHVFAANGLAALKIGEEARVPLATFSLAGGRGKELRTAINRLARERYSFQVVGPDKVEALLPELQSVSDEWLEARAASEKGFSLGYFKPEYLRRFPVAMIERAGTIVAFANLWTTADRSEISPDLMRQTSDAPPGTMDALFAQTMLWAREEGYQWFNLGMAPLSGLPTSPDDSLWIRVGDFIYRHGEAFYNFQGLRTYKEKFSPVWEPRYLVYPGRLTLARALPDLAALVAGGYGRIFRRGMHRAA